MAKRQVKLTFPPDLIKEPIIYQLGQQFRVVTSILRASVDIDWGWVILQLEGDADDTEEAVSWVTAKGVSIESANIDTTD